jgi:hypothetical protein
MIGEWRILQKISCGFEMCELNMSFLISCLTYRHNRAIWTTSNPYTATCIVLLYLEFKRRAHWLVEILIVDCAVHGGGEYRTHLAVMDQAAETYNWNNKTLLRFNEAIKNTLDTKEIFVPGKNGIWPETYQKSLYKL